MSAETEAIDLSLLSLQELGALANENGLSGFHNRTRSRLTSALLTVLGGEWPDDGYDASLLTVQERRAIEDAAPGGLEPGRVYGVGR